MKEYIRKNLTPIAVGLALGLTISSILSTVESIVVKIALIHEERFVDTAENRK